MNPIDLFIFEHMETMVSIALLIPFAVVAYLTRNNHGQRVYTLPDTIEERVQ